MPEQEPIEHGASEPTGRRIIGWLIALAVVVATVGAAIKWRGTSPPTVGRREPDWLRVTPLVEPRPVRIPAESKPTDLIPAEPGALAGCNVLLVTLDTTRADRLGCYGNDRIETPTLDGLARQGILFTRAVTPVPVTLPAHTSLLTGLYPFHHGVRTNGRFILAEKERTLAEALSGAGYVTGAFVSAFVLDAYWGLDQGFGEYDADMQHNRDDPADSFPERSADQTNERAIAWLRAHHGGRFFLWVQYYDPHVPYRPPEPYASQYARLPYDGEIAFMDCELGKLLAVVDDLGLADSTLVVVAGDHGEGLGQHRELEHGYLLYESTSHVPLILRCGQRLGGGVHIDRLVSLIDVAPTVLSLLGIEWTGPCDGVDLTRAAMSAVGGAARSSDRPRLIFTETLYGALTEGFAPLLAVYDDTTKYIHGPDSELFDLAADPFELKNLAASRTDAAARMQQAIAEAFGTDLGGLTTLAAGADVTAEQQSRIESLGYVGEVGSAPSSGPQPDPKTLIVSTELASQTVARKSELGLDGVVRRLEELVEFYPDSHKALVELGRHYGLRRQFSRAEETLLQALQVYPESTQALRLLGDVRLSRGDKDAAAETYRQVLAVAPENWHALSRLAGIRLTQQKTEEAIVLLKQMFAYRPQEPSAYRNLVTVLAGTSRTEEAIALLTDALDAHPELSGVRSTLFELLMREQRYNSAAEVLRAGLATSADDPALIRGLVDFLLHCPDEHLRSPAEAIGLLKRLCADVGAATPEDLLLLADAHQAADQYDEAIAALEAAQRAATTAGNTALADTIAARLRTLRESQDSPGVPASQPRR